MSLVLELQQAIDSDEKVSKLLTKSYIIAKKLDQKDILEWIELERNGYTYNNTIPSYRHMHTEYRLDTKGKEQRTYTISQSRIREIEQKTKQSFYISKLHQPIETIEGMQISSEPLQLSNIITECLKKYGGYDYPVYAHIAHVSLIEILTHVKNKLLDWALELEKQGILGENMTFTKEEKETASNITINNYGHNSNIQAGGHDNTINSNNDFTVEQQADFQKQFNELKKLINQHKELSNNEDIQEDLEDITKQLEKPTPRPTKIINACNNILPLVKNIPAVVKAITSLKDLF